jgi:hypothetical protein
MAQIPAAPGAPPPPPAPDLQAKRQQFLQSRRGDVSRQANAGLQQNQDAINRKFASMGASGSGASIAANLKAQDQSSAQAQQGMAGVDAQELQMMEGDATRGQQESQFARQLTNQQDQFGKQFGEGQRQFDAGFGLQRSQFEDQQLQDYLQNMQAMQSAGVPIDLGGVNDQVYGTGSVIDRRLNALNPGRRPAHMRKE